MNSKVLKGTQRSPAARQDAGRPRRDARPMEQPAANNPEAEALLRRFLTEVHSYRQIGNAALRDLESRLLAMSRRSQPQPQPEPPDVDEYYAPPASARMPSRQPERRFSRYDEDPRTLDERLSELSTYLHAGLGGDEDIPVPPRWREAPAAPRATANSEAAAAPRQPQPKPAPTAPVLDRAWFEERFAVMRASIDEMAIPVQRLETLETQFKELMERLDARDTTRGSMGQVEDGLKRLAAYLEDSKRWNTAHDNRMRGVEQRLDHLSGLVAQSHAAIAATAKGLEVVAKGTGPRLASATADMVAKRVEEQVEEKIVQLNLKRPIEDLGQEVSALSMHARQSARSMDEKLKQFQLSLDEGLMRREEESRPVERPKPKPPTTESIEKYLQAKTYDESEGEDYDRELIAAAQRAARLAGGPQDELVQAEPSRYQIPYGEFLPEEERRNSHLGLIAAAVILLLASAVMLYLNLRDKEVFGLQPTGASVSRNMTSGGELVRAKQPSPGKRDPGKGARAELPAGVVLSDDEAVRMPRATAAMPKRDGGPASLISTDTFSRTGAARGSAPATTAEQEKNASVREAAVKGDREAQFAIGQSYLTGRGAASSGLAPEERMSKAARWFRRAAESGHATSQFRLATLYELGRGAPKDLARAEIWYRRAAAQGHVKAMHNLAVLAVPGRGKQANYLTAAKWFSAAAAYGLPDSQYNLAMLYERGLGVRRDLAKAYQWYALAVRNGDDRAAGKRDALARRLNTAERATADAAIALWSPRIADAVVNRDAPEPPAGAKPVRKAAATPARPRAQVMKANWQAGIAAHDPLVAQVQRHLKRLGYEPGPVDGIHGRRTAAAIRSFEARHGLTQAGKSTKAILQRLVSARS